MRTIIQKPSDTTLSPSQPAPVKRAKPKRKTVYKALTSGIPKSLPETVPLTKLIAQLHKHARNTAVTIRRRTKRRQLQQKLVITLCQRCGRVMPAKQRATGGRHYYCSERCTKDAARLKARFKAAHQLQIAMGTKPIRIVAYFEVIDMEALKKAQVIA